VFFKLVVSAVSSYSAVFVVFFSWNGLYFVLGNFTRLSAFPIYERIDGWNTLFVTTKVNTQVHLS